MSVLPFVLDHRAQQNARQRAYRAKVRRAILGERLDVPARAFRYPIPKHVATDPHHCPGLIAYALLYPVT